MDEAIDAIQQLFLETGKRHHEAFIEADGADPDWPLWYAESMRDALGALLGAKFTKSELVYLIVGLDKEVAVEAPGAEWTSYYARALAARYL